MNVLKPGTIKSIGYKNIAFVKARRIIDEERERETGVSRRGNNDANPY